MILRRRILATGLTLIATLLSGYGAQAAGLPLPWLLGALLASAALALSGVRILGEPPQFPSVGRLIAVPVIGVTIGAGLTPEIARQIAGWWPSLLSVLPYAVLLQVVNYAVFRRLGGYDKPTAFFAASPGGLVEAVLLGEKEGGNVALMSVQHFSRIALSVSAIPLIFVFTTGEQVGSAAGAAMPGGDAWPTLADAALLAAAAVIGVPLGRALRLPAAIMIGPMALSALLHVAGLSSASVPQPVVAAAQLVVGTAIGLRFVGQDRASIFSGLGLALIAVTISITAAATAASLLSTLGLASWDAIFLAFAPGGVAEMGLVALSLGISPVYVSIHHVARIVLAVALSRAIFRIVLRLS